MARYYYTADDIAALSVLADEARTLESDERTLMAEVGEIFDRVAGFWNVVDNVRSIDPGLYVGRYPELDNLVALTTETVFAAPHRKLPVVGQFAYPTIQRPADWRRKNNQLRKHISAIRAALEVYAQEQPA